jgi:hypothetical protein
MFFNNPFPYKISGFYTKNTSVSLTLEVRKATMLVLSLDGIKK